MILDTIVKYDSSTCEQVSSDISISKYLYSSEELSIYKEQSLLGDKVYFGIEKGTLNYSIDYYLLAFNNVKKTSLISGRTTVLSDNLIIKGESKLDNSVGDFVKLVGQELDSKQLYGELLLEGDEVIIKGLFTYSNLKLEEVSSNFIGKFAIYKNKVIFVTNDKDSGHYLYELSVSN